MKPKLLDLFCGAGGAAMGYYRAGFEVIGVDINPQPNYPFEFKQADAMTYPLDDFDVIHASPPCQHYTMMQRICKNKGSHPDLVEATRERLKASDKPYIIENVVGAPLIDAIILCGTMFGLRIARHRQFETNFNLYPLLPSCAHYDLYDQYHGGEMARGEREKLSKVMGIDWFMRRPEVRNAIPPVYTEWIGRQIA
jgi:DNA (cytosine-5)-methyltransferase 1